MKSPDEIRCYLRRQWEKPSAREFRLLGGAAAWPWSIPIHLPTARAIGSDFDSVKRHVETWRKVRVGQVQFDSLRFRATDSSVEIPSHWILNKPSDWIDAIQDSQVRREFESLAWIVERTDPIFHRFFLRRRSAWVQRAVEETVQATQLAMLLEPGGAAGKPLRSISLAGIDTKFFERNASLITMLLDIRFDGEVSRLGLESFLDAWSEREHWLLVVDLDGTLLPFERMRVRSSELKRCSMPGRIVLIVENETCLHQLPKMPDTVAILGAGFDLSWVVAKWLQSKRVGYWGDIDTWGLMLLSKVRDALPGVEALLMDSSVYETHASLAVVEPVVASHDSPSGLSSHESQLYLRLLKEPCGRLEQEFLPKEVVVPEILGLGRM